MRTVAGTDKALFGVVSVVLLARGMEPVISALLFGMMHALWPAAWWPPAHGVPESIPFVFFGGV